MNGFLKQHDITQQALNYHQLQASNRRFQVLMMRSCYLAVQVVVGVVEGRTVALTLLKCAVLGE